MRWGRACGALCLFSVNGAEVLPDEAMVAQGAEPIVLVSCSTLWLTTSPIRKTDVLAQCLLNRV